eukprot:TRINITY_DN5459_c0_g1_i2.p1 TRINITY_DN5459_c0_g1~~TRINITY_DN5459_c0_g1_i2.p1  ORF type:complete len:337 (-),score=41.98 TRINITY_DN5459_c0_g1_i2:114-1124(-)
MGCKPQARRFRDSNAMLQADIPENVVFQHLIVDDPLQPLSWKVRNILGHEKELRNLDTAQLFFEDTSSSLKKDLDAIYVSISQDEDGQHRFVNMGKAQRLLKHSAAASLMLQTSPESEVKSLVEDGRAVALFARPRTDQVASEQPAKLDLGARDDLCPKSVTWTNYDVIPDLSIGRTQRLILCDEATLTRDMPSEKIFEHLKLIVNCHEHRVAKGKYRIGSCSTEEHPAVICEAVHSWHAADTARMNEKNDAIQAAIWENLQHGTVAVHCLAGIHRAACIVACHFLYRHYVLGHTELPCDPKEIYRRLKAARPHVDPAYAHVLKSYQTHLRRKTGE